MAYPRAQGASEDHFLISAGAWNEMADGIESAEKLSAAAPLQVTKTPSGKTLSINLPESPLKFRIAGSSISGDPKGFYSASQCPSPQPDTSGDASASDLNSSIILDNLIAIDLSQVDGTGPQRTLDDEFYTGPMIGFDTVTGLPVVAFRSSVQQIRLSADGTKLQVTYVSNPTSDDYWMDMVDAGDCDAV